MKKIIIILLILLNINIYSQDIEPRRLFSTDTMTDIIAKEQKGFILGVELGFCWIKVRFCDEY